jgi:hypothetical protein
LQFWLSRRSRGAYVGDNIGGDIDWTKAVNKFTGRRATQNKLQSRKRIQIY